MGRKKLALKRIENSTARQVTYSKRKDGMIKKANELAVLCDIDIALIMFSPSGRLTSFSNRKRVEDVFIRFLDRADELREGTIASRELLIQKLRKLKDEADMVEKIAFIEALEEKLQDLNNRKQMASEKLRYYQPSLEKKSPFEVDEHIQFLEAALQRIRSARAKLLGKDVVPQGLENAEGVMLNSQVTAFSMVGESSTGNQHADLQQTRVVGVPAQELNVEDYLPTAPHVSLDYLRRAQNQWYMSNSQRAPDPGSL